MKGIKIISLICVLVLCASLLSGCGVWSAQTTIRLNGSGEVVMSVGAPKESVDAALEAKLLTEEDVKDWVSFTHNGVECLGMVEKQTFQTPEELKQLTDIFTLIKNGDGTLNLGFYSQGKTGNAEEVAQLYTNSMGISPEDVDTLLEETSFVYEFTFPATVKQVVGETEGITIDGKTLTVDMLALKDIAYVGDIAYEFSTAKDPVSYLSVSFTDVNKGDWFADAVYACAFSGWVEGVGGGLFLPEGTLTYAEYAQVVARFAGAEVGEENGYWAAKAIKTCIKNQIIPDLGEVTPENYDVPITREVAIGSMLASGVTISQEETEAIRASVPDFGLIDPTYWTGVAVAYYTGLTHGVDETGRFDPKATLTRAEICQLLCNLGSALQNAA